MKLAKFVQASAALPDTIRRKELYDRARQMLIQIGHQGSGLWSATLGTEMPRYSATCEGLLALAVSDQRAVQETLRSGYSFLLNTLQSDITAKWKIVLLWTLVEISLKLGEPPPSQVVRLSREILPLIDTLDDALVVEYFPTVKGDSDFYHFNVNLLGARATVDLYQLDLLDESYLRFAIPIVASIAENIGQNGRYRTPAQDAQPRFWEHYQAMSLLGDFCRLMEAKSVASELAYMWISPRHFEPRTFLIDDKLAVVLMPLSTDWSNDVYKAISEVKKIGETTYRYWRSDLRFQDDKIMQSIWEEINRARFIVADCTGRNPNVFYELGIAHTIGKSVFICAQNRADIPFDLAAIRSFEYGGATPTKLRGLKVALRKFLEDLR
ncbi:MAG TPA: hypothetical protein VHR45_20840 [Thermoanaerobaculia bacterium]|nr:hypothetical protein [Thermoanaerobaculia bacterium]